MSIRPALRRDALCAVLLIAAAHLHAADTVRIGDETKTRIGTITDLQSGDVACYLTLKDDHGAEFSEMGEFSICEQGESLLGHRVSLDYALEQVIADSCQGDPECTQTQTVALVTRATPIAAAAASTPARSALCTAKESVVFACRTGAKRVSVCASSDAAEAKGFLQYRFGKPDADAAPELVLPADQRAPDAAAHGATVAFSGGGGAWLRFRNGDHAYVVYTGIGRWGAHGETQEKQGVVVEHDGRSIATLACSGEATSLLDADWYARMGIEADAADFLFPD